MEGLHMLGRVFDWMRVAELVQPLVGAVNDSMSYLNVPYKNQQIIKGIYTGVTKGAIPFFRTINECSYDPTICTPPSRHSESSLTSAGLVNLAQVGFSITSAGLQIAAIAYQPADAQKNPDDAAYSNFLSALSIFSNGISLVLLRYKEILQEDARKENKVKNTHR